MSTPSGTSPLRTGGVALLALAAGLAVVGAVTLGGETATGADAATSSPGASSPEASGPEASGPEASGADAPTPEAPTPEESSPEASSSTEPDPAEPGPSTVPSTRAADPTTPRPTPGTTPSPRSGAPTQLLPPARPVPTATMGAVAARATVGVTVLNNSRVQGLGASVADDLGGLGWNVTDVQGLAGRNRVSTVYYRPGTTEEQAAEFLAADVGAGATDTRPEALESLPAGLLLVVTKDYEGPPKGS